MLKRGATRVGPASAPWPVRASVTFMRALVRASPDVFVATYKPHANDAIKINLHQSTTHAFIDACISQLDVVDN